MIKAALYLLAILAAGSGAAFAIRAPRHWPVVGMFSTGIACDAVLDLCDDFAVCEVAGALYPWAVLAACPFALARSSAPQLATRTFFELAAYLALLHVTGFRGKDLKVAYLLAQFFLVARLVDQVVRWYRRPGRRRAGPTERIAVAASAAELLNIWAYAGLPGNWHLARTSYAMLWIASIYLQGRALLCRPSTPRTSQPQASSR